MSTDILQGRILTGYHREDTFIASRKYMGGRPVYHLDMCIAQLTAGVDAPPVGIAQEDNRIVKESRGRLFRDYVNTNKEWASPSLLLWCPIDILSFESLPQINDLVNDPSVVLGVLSVPRNSRQSIKIHKHYICIVITQTNLEHRPNCKATHFGERTKWGN